MFIFLIKTSAHGRVFLVFWGRQERKDTDVKPRSKSRLFILKSFRFLSAPVPSPLGRMEAEDLEAHLDGAVGVAVAETHEKRAPHWGTEH